MNTQTSFSDLLRLDAARAVDQITSAIRTHLKVLRRKGAVIGLSGGIDSSVVTAHRATINTRRDMRSAIAPRGTWMATEPAVTPTYVVVGEVVEPGLHE